MSAAVAVDYVTMSASFNARGLLQTVRARLGGPFNFASGAAFWDANKIVQIFAAIDRYTPF